MTNNLSQRKVLLIGWDAADWKVINPLIDDGHMPNLQKLIESGVMGNIATLRPVFSPMLWTSIATGKRADKHGIHGFTEPNPSGKGIRPISNLSRKTKAVWNILNQNGLKSNVIAWWPSHPVEPIDGVMISNHFHQLRQEMDKPWALPPRSVHPERLRKPLMEMRIHPTELGQHDLLPFIPLADRIDQEKDHRLLALAKTICECSTVHAAATAVMQLEPWDFMAVYYDAIDHFGHGFMRYHPPQLDWINDEDYEIYQHVIDAAYKFHDMMLGTLMQLAGDNTTIMLVSDHGFHSDHLRPRILPNEPAGPASEHRDYGIFVLNGPGIKQDSTVFGATLLDITPTVLSLFDLAIGKDMDGRVLVSSFEQQPEIEFVDSWDQIEGNSGQHPPDMQLDSSEVQESIQQLVELGYIDQPDEDEEKAAQIAIREQNDNLARVYMDAARHQEAAEIYQKLWKDWPEEIRFGVRLLRCYVALKNTELARETLTRIKALKKNFTAAAQIELDEIKARAELEKANDKPPEKKELFRRRNLAARSKTNIHALAFLEACVLEMELNFDRALKLLRSATSTERANQARVYQKIGELSLRLRKWNEAFESFQTVLEIDPLNYLAHTGMSRYYLRQKDYEKAAESARRSIGLLFQNPVGHYFHGLAPYRMGELQLSVRAFEMAIRQNDNFPLAHRRLAFVFRRDFQDDAKANYHAKKAQQARDQIRVRRPIANAKTISTSPEMAATQDSLLSKSKTGIIKPSADDVITVVSGLPRSGTSMMMQMLAAGGLSLMSDGQRQTDENNPKGYYELEQVKQTADDQSWVKDCQGKVVKVIAQLVPFLPPAYNYRFIFMIRSLDEVLRSQTTMLNRLGKRPVDDTNSLNEVFAKQLQRAIRVVTENPRAEFITISHQDALSNPQQTVAQVCGFLHQDLDRKAMQRVVDPALYRSKCQ